MSEFVASSGVTIKHDGGRIDWVSCSGTSLTPHGFSTNETEALREFFQHERDEELGRWRPEHPSDYVAYPQADGSVLAVDERSGIAETLYRPGDDRSPLIATAGGSATAHAYFDAHPERKPWDEAQRDDVWLFKSETKRGLALAWRAEDSWDVIDQRGNFHSAIQDVPQDMRDHSFYGWDNPTAELIHRIERPES